MVEVVGGGEVGGLWEDVPEMAGQNREEGWREEVVAEHVLGVGKGKRT